jgi:hypothetical protein
MNNSLTIVNEKQLHHQVVKFIRKNSDLIIYPGFISCNMTHHQVIECKNSGYQKGSYDLLLLGRNNIILFIEFKNPVTGGVISDEQKEFKTKLNNFDYENIISNDYNEIIIKIIRVFNILNI